MGFYDGAHQHWRRGTSKGKRRFFKASDVCGCRRMRKIHLARYTLQDTPCRVQPDGSLIDSRCFGYPPRPAQMGPRRCLACTLRVHVCAYDQWGLSNEMWGRCNQSTTQRKAQGAWHVPLGSQQRHTVDSRRADIYP